MTSTFPSDFRHDLNEHGTAIARLEERDKARDISIQKIENNVTWLIRGLVLVLLTVVGNLVVLLTKK